MTEMPAHVPSEPDPDRPAAADPGEQGPTPAPGFGEHRPGSDLPPRDEVDGPADEPTDVTDAVRARDEPPFRTPTPDA